MKKPNLQNKELDRIGRELLEATLISNEEIEQIVAAPRLFDSVKARIKTEQNLREQKRFYGNWQISPVWNWQRISVVSAVFMFFIFGLIGLVAVNKSLQIDEHAVALPQIQRKIESVEILPIPNGHEISYKVDKTEKSEIESRPIAQKTAFRQENVNKPERKAKFIKQTPKTEFEPKTEFYALNFAGNIGETGEELQVVRTELTPAALFALGVNLPIENAPKKIKTDLLVGSDGVARAIRFVE